MLGICRSGGPLIRFFTAWHLLWCLCEGGHQKNEDHLGALLSSGKFPPKNLGLVVKVSIWYVEIAMFHGVHELVICGCPPPKRSSLQHWGHSHWLGLRVNNHLPSFTIINHQWIINNKGILSLDWWGILQFWWFCSHLCWFSCTHLPICHS